MTSFSCFYYWLWTDFTHYSGVSVVNFFGLKLKNAARHCTYLTAAWAKQKPEFQLNQFSAWFMVFVIIEPEDLYKQKEAFVLKWECTKAIKEMHLTVRPGLTKTINPSDSNDRNEKLIHLVLLKIMHSKNKTNLLKLMLKNKPQHMETT